MCICTHIFSFTITLQGNVIEIPSKYCASLSKILSLSQIFLNRVLFCVFFFGVNDLDPKYIII